MFQSFHRKGSAGNEHFAALLFINAEESVFISTLVLVILAPKEARFPRLGQFSLERRLVNGSVIKKYLGF